MTPTSKLRFVEREEKHWHDHRTYTVRRIRVLQQWWEPHYPGSAMQGEWRDVPMEVEE